MTFSLYALPSAAAVIGPGVFVGRAGELAELEAAAAAARCGEPKVVLVEGEGGIGKSSLVTNFASGLAGATVLRASGDEAELLLPYGVVGQLVASARETGWPAGITGLGSERRGRSICGWRRAGRVAGSILPRPGNGARGRR